MSSMITRPLRTEIVIQDAEKQSTEKDVEENTATASTLLAPHIAPAICVFCTENKQANYLCPRCHQPYCSLPCYRSEQHTQCSDNFYKDCVVEQLQVDDHEKNTGAAEGSKADEKKMLHMLNKELQLRANSTPNDDLPQSESENEDNTDDTYLDLVTVLTRDAVQREMQMKREDGGDSDESDSELDRQLTCAGMGTDLSTLLASLTTKERKNFEQLCEEMNVNRTQELSRSVFQKKKN